MNHPRCGAGKSVRIYILRNSVYKEQHSYLSYLFELVLVHVGENVEFRLGDDLESHGAVVVLQRGDVVVAHGQLRPRVDLVAEGRENREGKAPADTRQLLQTTLLALTHTLFNAYSISCSFGFFWLLVLNRVFGENRYYFNVISGADSHSVDEPSPIGFFFLL